MHDIICPNCGERFLGNDVSFDMSDYVLPLLYERQSDAETVKEVKFKFYVDEDMILSSNKDGNINDLECTNHGGPGFGDMGFPFKINGKILYKYIQEKIDLPESDLQAVMEDITKVVADKFKNVSPILLDRVSVLYHILFGASDKLAGEISIEDEYVQTAMKVLAHIYSKRQADTNDQSVTYGVSIYSSEMNGINGYHVPDILFVKRHTGFEPIYKCCCFCGEKLPTEFGYYKMKPVVLLGSHSSGKTSFLLSLLNTVSSGAPFVEQNDKRGESNCVVTLNEDPNLVAFKMNIERFQKGKPAEKTDFKNVPVLNLKFRNTIYSFIDWPGEKFVTSIGVDADYVFKSRRVINHARHIMFFIPPEQIDGGLEATEENVQFDLMTLGQSLKWHIDFPNRKKIRSISFIINKVDKLQNRPNADDLFYEIYGKSEVDFYNGSNWMEEVYHRLENASKNYIGAQNPQLSNLLNSTTPYGVNDLFKKHFIPVSPYGYDVMDMATDEESKNRVVHRGYLAGLPFLRILKDDLAIK